MIVLSTRKYKDGYEVREELHETDFRAEVISDKDGEAQEIANWINNNTDKTVVVKSAYTPEGYYIGNPKDAHYLIVERGIKPELVNPTKNVCSIGFCEKEQKWYGWSHRAIFGFGVGSEVKDGDCCASSGYTDEYLEKHPEDDLSLPIGFKAKDLIDAKRMAIAFADSVS